MKKSILSLLTVLMMFFYTPVSASTPEDTGLFAVCTNYNVSFAITGADVDYAMSTPDGDNGVLDIIVSGVTETITVTPTFTDNKVTVSGTLPEIINVDLSCGFAITEFEVLFKDSLIPAGRWTINAVDADFEEEESDNLIISTNPDETEVIYTQGTYALPLTVVAEYTGTAEEPITYQWYYNTQRSTEGSVAIEGATDTSYIPPTDTPGTVYYYAVAKCNGLTAISTFAEITVEAPELPTAQNVIDISDRVLQSQADEYAKLTDIKIIGVRLEKATENDTAINIVLDGNTPADAELLFEFGAELSSAEISGHTAAVKLNDGKATQTVTITAKSANGSSWEDSVTYTLNFSLGKPYERKAERIEITKKPSKTNYIEGETFDPSGMEVTVFYSDGSSSEAESFEYSPSDELTTDDTTITVAFRENKDDEIFVSADIAISVCEVPIEGDGDGYYEDYEPQYDSIKVYITFVNRGEIVAQNEEIEVPDEDSDGIYCIGDAFLNFHRMHYPGGESGYKEVSGNGLDGWVAKFWGGNDPTFTYARNYKWAKSTRDTIDDGDTIAVINGTDEMFYSDLYTWFEKSSYSARADEAIVFRVNGLNLMGSNASYDAVYAPEGATVTVYDQNGNEKEDLRTTVANDGTFTLRFTKTGTYTVKISGTAQWGSYDDAPVAPSFCTVKISDVSYAGGEGEETYYDDSENYEEQDTVSQDEKTDDSSEKADIPESTTVGKIDNNMEFTDIKGHWGEDSINFVCERGLYKGVGNGLFDTEGTMTRAMFVTVLYRLDGEPEITPEHNFADVSDSQWYSDSVEWANANGIVRGVNDNLFDPDADVTREQVATILYRYVQYLDMSAFQKGDLTQYNDCHKVSDWAMDAMEWSTGAGITEGKPGGILDPDANATRAEVAAVIQRFVTLR